MFRYICESKLVKLIFLFQALYSLKKEFAKFNSTLFLQRKAVSNFFLKFIIYELYEY